MIWAACEKEERDEGLETGQRRPENHRGGPQPAELRGGPVRGVHVDGARRGVQPAGEEQRAHHGAPGRGE